MATARTVGNSVNVKLNGQSKWFNLGSIPNGLRFYMGGGNDSVDASQSSLRTFQQGQDGNDTLLGGTGTDTLDGGSGTDRGLYGESLISIEDTGNGSGGGSGGGGTGGGGGGDDGGGSGGGSTTGPTRIDWSNNDRLYGFVRTAEAQGAVLDGKFYLYSGYDPFFVTQNIMQEYDPATRQWRSWSLPFGITHAGTTTVGDTAIYAGGLLGLGNERIAIKTVRTYHAPTNTWSRLPDLPDERGGGNLVTVGRTIHFFGGQLADDVTETLDHWTLDLDNTGAGWQTKRSMPIGRTHMGSVYLNGKIYVVGGQLDHDVQARERGE
ncbi:MAG: hypothetical protein AAGK78_16715, partial [Planctomycetota bacterium]